MINFGNMYNLNASRLTVSVVQKIPQKQSIAIRTETNPLLFPKFPSFLTIVIMTLLKVLFTNMQANKKKC